MNEIYVQESETERVRGAEEEQDFRVNTDGSEDVGRVGEGAGGQRLAPHRKDRKAGDWTSDPIGGILDQLIEDARKQLAKSRECIVWYQSEAKECEDKLRNLLKLKELQEWEEQENDSEDNPT